MTWAVWHHKLKPDFVETICGEPSRKHDVGKTRFELVDPYALEQLARVLTYGARKYSAGEWRGLENWAERYHGALMRHLIAWQGGEQMDPESGLPHLSHVLCNAHFLVALDRESKSPTRVAEVP